MKDLIAKCVMQGVMFPGNAGALYSVQQLVQDTSLNSLRAMGQRLEKLMLGKTASKFTKAEITAEDQILALQIDTLLAIISYKEDNAARAAKAAETRKENLEKRAVLQKVIAEKKLEAFGSKDIGDLEKMLEELA